jgi:hypothetical protein
VLKDPKKRQLYDQVRGRLPLPIARTDSSTFTLSIKSTACALLTPAEAKTEASRARSSSLFRRRCACSVLSCPANFRRHCCFVIKLSTNPGRTSRCALACDSSMQTVLLRGEKF